MATQQETQNKKLTNLKFSRRLALQLIAAAENDMFTT
jgi:hypothetical protein